MLEVAAVRTVSPIKNGCTKPFFVSCSDGEVYAVKFSQNPEGKRVLINEFVCSKIAEKLELPIPTSALVRCDEQFIQLYGEEIERHILSKLNHDGVHFGTLKIKKTFTITGTAMLEMAENLEVVPEIFLFDQLICNVDRDSNGGNLLFDASNMKITIIDHTHVFDLGAIWDVHQLKRRIGEPFHAFDSSGFVYKKLVPFIRGNNPFHSIINKMNRITEDDLMHIINSVPEEWGLKEEEGIVLHEYLYDRLSRIEEALHVLKPHLPYWKGGD